MARASSSAVGEARLRARPGRWLGHGVALKLVSRFSARADGHGIGPDHLDPAVGPATPLTRAGRWRRLSAVCPPMRGQERRRAAHARTMRLDAPRGSGARCRWRSAKSGVGHDGGRVGVGQDHPGSPRPASDPAGLRVPGVVELAGLADDDRPGADDQDGGRGRSRRGIRPGYARPGPRPGPMRAAERSKRWRASEGTGARPRGGTAR